ncbi:MAG: hypothetical protein ACKOES_16040 [Planctomycetaceae bacterium]
MPLHRLPRARLHLGPERLEPRALLAADVDPPGGATHDPGPDSDAGIAFVTSSEVAQTSAAPAFSAGFPESAAERPWITAASSAPSGAVVYWLKLTVRDGVTSTQVVPIWGRLNPPGGADASTPPGDPAPLAAAVDGVVFGGPGSPLDASSPLSFADLAGFTPPATDGVHDDFLVARSDSNFALTSLSTALVMVAQLMDQPMSDTDGTAGVPEEPMPAPLSWLARLRTERPFGPAVDPAAAFPAGPGNAAWLVDAQQGDTGVIVLWITDDSIGESSSFTVMPLWLRLNPDSVVDPAMQLFADGGSESTSSTVVYAGDGSLLGGSEPIPFDTFDGQTGPTDGGQSAFVVFRSRSNMEIMFTTMVMVMVQAPDGAVEGGMSGSGDWSALLRGLGASVAAPEVHLVRDTGHSAEDRITRDGRLRVDTAPGFRAEYSRDGGETWRRGFRARPGGNTVLVRQVDRDGLASPATTFTFTLDRSRPLAPRMTVAGGDAPVALAISEGSLTVAGIEPGARVEYSVNGRAWTESLEPRAGRNLVRVRQVDVAGNVSRVRVPMRVWGSLAAGDIASESPTLFSVTPRRRCR